SKSGRGKYFKDSDILYHHFEGVRKSHIPCLFLKHSYNSWKRTSAANQLKENELLVVHSDYIPGPQLIEE
ncbi:hypothetical protein MKW94_029172, partial [Papaver nudicaule]|nr:hypothetical protein [Papaver nudicaule]